MRREKNIKQNTLQGRAHALMYSLTQRDIIMKKAYEIVVDVETTFRLLLVAENEAEAREIALQRALDDADRCRASTKGASVYSVDVYDGIDDA
jgi:hypothetical protein